MTPNSSAGSSSEGAEASPASAIAVLGDEGIRLLIDSEALQQAVYLYRPVFDSAGFINDLEIVYVNEAARRVPLAEHILEGVLVSAVFVDLHEALDAANVAWSGGRPEPYRVERRGFSDGVPTHVRYEVATMRAGSYVVQVSADRTTGEQLASADARFRLMAESSSDCLILVESEPDDRHFVLSYANPRALLAEPSFRLGKRVAEVMDQSLIEVADALRAGAPVRRLLQRDVLARRVSLEATFTDVGAGQMMVSVRELTSREVALLELERSDRVLRAVGDGAFGSIAVYEPQFMGRDLVRMVLLWSSAGHSHSVAGRSSLDVTAVLSSVDLVDMAQAMVDTGEKIRSGWVPVFAPEGRERSIEFTLVVAGDRFVLEFVERTDELAARTELATVSATADAQRSFLSRVSHEMRSPLNVIHGYSQLLSGLHLSEPAVSYVGHIESGASRMVQIVDDLMLLSQLDQGLLRLEHQEVTTRELAEAVVAVAATQAWWREGVVMYLADSESVPTMLRTDPSRFRLTATLLAGASLDAALDPLEVRPFARGTRAGVEFVVDAASPMVQSVWLPFVKTHTIPGAGLGLAVARSMARALDMVVEVRDDTTDPARVRLVLSLPAGT